MTGVDTGLTFAHGVLTDVPYKTKVYDVSNAYNTTTGEFTVPEAGVYVFTWNSYASNNNSEWETIASLQEKIKQLNL